MSEALTRFQPKPIDRVEAISERFDELRGQCNLISPLSAVDQIMPMHQISLRVVKLDSSEESGDVYSDARFCKPNEVCLTKQALTKLMAASGATILSSRRTDERKEAFYCEYEVVLAIQDFDGGWRTVVATKAIDLTDGSPDAMKPERDSRGSKTGSLVLLDPAALGDRRRHITSLAETKALTRALRALLSLKQKFTKAELAKPFVVPKLVPALDPTDPDQKRALIEMATRSSRAVGGRPPEVTKATLMLPGVSRVEDATGEDELVDLETGELLQPEPEPVPALESISFVDCEPDPDELTGTACACRCNVGRSACGREMTAERAKLTRDRKGMPLCPACYPGGRWYAAESHQQGGGQ